MPKEGPPHPNHEKDRFFPEVRAIHEAILDDSNEYPEGWVEQAQFRERYDLPPFRPPRFADGTVIDNVVVNLESDLGVTIEFVERNVDDGWHVKVDGLDEFPVDRTRDNSANTVVTITSDEFIARIRESL